MRMATENNISRRWLSFSSANTQRKQFYAKRPSSSELKGRASSEEALRNFAWTFALALRSAAGVARLIHCLKVLVFLAKPKINFLFLLISSSLDPVFPFSPELPALLYVVPVVTLLFGGSSVESVPVGLSILFSTGFPSSFSICFAFHSAFSPSRSNWGGGPTTFLLLTWL